jgi:hypothetical protein
LGDTFDLDDVHQPDWEAAVTSNDAVNLDFALVNDLDRLFGDVREPKGFADDYHEW